LGSHGALPHGFALANKCNPGGLHVDIYTYSTFGILLVLVGCRILLSDGAAAIACFLLALACIGAGGLWARLTLEVHGGFYLLLALLLSGALRESTRLLLGTDPWSAFTSPAPDSAKR
jgi:hypothetical protein